jgi:hypothetical protein
MSEDWLDKARMRGDGPPFVKFGRSVRYSKRVLVDWWNSRLQQSTCPKLRRRRDARTHKDTKT